MTRIAVLVGNPPQPASRTRLVAEEVAVVLGVRGGADVDATIDLADVAETLFRFPEPASTNCWIGSRPRTWRSSRAPPTRPPTRAC